MSVRAADATTVQHLDYIGISLNYGLHNVIYQKLCDLSEIGGDKYFQ